jgi:N-acyl-D-aspartate/D-glutamate deacylase
MEELGEYFNTIDSLPLGVNFSAYVGHGTLRILAMGFVDKKPSHEELLRMKSLLREAMEAGALGMSTGLFYPRGFGVTSMSLRSSARCAGRVRRRFCLSHAQ